MDEFGGVNPPLEKAESSGGPDVQARPVLPGRAWESRAETRAGESRRGGGLACSVVAWLIVVSLCAGGLGGAAAGGAIAYRLAASRPAAGRPAAPTRVVVLGQETTGQAAVTALHLDVSSAIVEAVAKVRPAVVTVLNTQRAQQILTFWGVQEIQPKSSGSGVVISPDGYIITNNHVVENWHTLQVVYVNGDKAPARFIGADPYGDIAVIKVDGPVPGVAEFGDSDALKPGETVIAIGSALGDFKNTVTVGVVSALERSLDTGKGYSLEGMIQTDAAINHGNSGGPLLNVMGQVVGINTAVVRGGDASGDVAEGLGFAAPSATMADISAQLIAKGYVDRPYLGIRYQMITPEVAGANGLPMEWGVYLQGVERDSTADQGGLQRGDIITAIGDDVIGATMSFINALNHHQVGERVVIKYWRDGRTLETEVTLGGRSKS